MSTAIFTQEKYEQAVVTQVNDGGISIFSSSISIENKEHKKEKINRADVSDTYDVSYLLKQVAVIRNDGWEIWNSTSFLNVGGLGCTYFLRRKLK